MFAYRAVIVSPSASPSSRPSSSISSEESFALPFAAPLLGYTQRPPSDGRGVGSGSAGIRNKSTTESRHKSTGKQAGLGMRSMETCLQSGAHPKGKERKIHWRGRQSATRESPPGLLASLGKASSYFGFFDLRIASWILGTSVPLKKGPSARGLQTAPHSKTGTRALLGPCAPAFRRWTLRRRRRSRRRCCCTLSAACTRSALVRS